MIYSDNRDGIWQRKMYHANNEKQKTTNDERNKTTKSRKNQNIQREGNIQMLGNIGSGHHQISGDERKNFKRIPQENEKITRNQTISQKSHQRNKYLGCPPRKVLGNILKVDKRTSTNEPENEKTHNDA